MSTNKDSNIVVVVVVVLEIIERAYGNKNCEDLLLAYKILALLKETV